jgi:hypothetical protein
MVSWTLLSKISFISNLYFAETQASILLSISTPKSCQGYHITFLDDEADNMSGLDAS